LYEPLTKEEVDAAVERAGVRYGLIEPLIARAIGKPLLVPRQIAQGLEPRRSEDGRLEYGFKIASKAPQDDEEDRVSSVDWFEMFTSQMVQQGDALATAVPPVPGTAGRNVLGQELPVAEGATIDIAALAGENTEVRENVLYAVMGGEPVLEGGKVKVLELLDFPQDIDFASGNVRFPGTVHVKRSINPGFRVEVRDNIEIGQSVEAATVIAGGDALIGGGFLGDAEGRQGSLKVGGNLSVRFIAGGEVAVGGNLTVGQDIVRGDIGVLGSVKVEGRGRIVGAKVSAGTEIVAKSIGAPGGARTVVTVGNPNSEARTVALLLEARALVRMNDQGVIDENVESDAATEATEEGGAGGGDEGEKKVEKAAKRGPRLAVSGEIYPGTVVGVGRAATVIQDKLQHCVLREVDGAIQVFPL